MKWSIESIPPEDRDRPIAEILVAHGRKCRRCKQINEEVGNAEHYADLCFRCDYAVMNYDILKFGQIQSPVAFTSPPQPREIVGVVGPMTIFGDSKGYGHYEVSYTYDLDRGLIDPGSIRYWASGNKTI